MKSILGRSFALLLVVLLSISSIGSINVKANPLIFPDINNPTINILTPAQNQTYPSGNLWLNFTVHKPEDWINNYNSENSNTSQNQGQILFIKILFRFSCPKIRDEKSMVKELHRSKY